MDLRHIHRLFYPIAPKYTFLLSTDGIFSRKNHMLGQKASLHKIKKIEIIASIFSDHNDMKLKINNRRKTEIFTKVWKLNNTRLNN